MSKSVGVDFSQIEAYRGHVCETFLNIDLDIPAASVAFKAEFQTRSVGLILATMARTEGLQGVLSARRERRHILAEHDDHMVFLLVRSGVVRHTQFGHTATTAPGFGVLIDPLEPYHVQHAGSAASLHFRVPRSLLRASLGAPERNCGFAIDARAGFNAVARDTLASVWRHAIDFAAEEEAEMMRRVTEAISVLCASNRKTRIVPDATLTQFRRARIYIESHLDDPDLDPPQVAAALKISVGYLHSVMRAQSTSVERLMTTLRLDRAREALTDPRMSDRTIARVAMDWGFADAAHFSRAFKSRFGITPRECRSAVKSAALAVAQHY